MTNKVISFVVATVITWAVLFTVFGLVFRFVFNMEDTNPDYEYILRIWHTVCYLEFIPAALVGIHAARNNWWD